MPVVVAGAKTTAHGYERARLFRISKLLKRLNNYDKRHILAQLGFPIFNSQEVSAARDALLQHLKNGYGIDPAP